MSYSPYVEPTPQKFLKPYRYVGTAQLSSLTAVVNLTSKKGEFNYAGVFASSDNTSMKTVEIKVTIDGIEYGHISSQNDWNSHSVCIPANTNGNYMNISTGPIVNGGLGTQGVYIKIPFNTSLKIEILCKADSGTLSHDYGALYSIYE